MNYHDIPHYDGAGRLVYWVFIQERDDKDPIKGFITTLGREGPVDSRGNHLGPYIVDRPYFSDLGCNWFCLTDEIHDWLMEKECQYTLEFRWTYDRKGWHVGLYDKAIAALFKLSWGDL